jgi:hypothetical protein
MAKAQAANILGIDNLKKVFAFLLLTSSMILELVKNFTYGKALSLAFHIGENLDILDAGKVALAEFRDLSVEETRELTAYLGDEFDLENDQLEQRIEDGIELIPEGYAHIKATIVYYEKVRRFVASWKQPDPAKIPQLEKALRKLDLPSVRQRLPAAA